MREKPHIAMDVDSEEMRKWRGLSQSEIGPMLEEFDRKNGGGSSEHVQGRRKQKKGF